jgi:hypothetical protein
MALTSVAKKICIATYKNAATNRRRIYKVVGGVSGDLAM